MAEDPEEPCTCVMCHPELRPAAWTGGDAEDPGPPPKKLRWCSGRGRSRRRSKWRWRRFSPPPGVAVGFDEPVLHAFDFSSDAFPRLARSVCEGDVPRAPRLLDGAPRQECARCRRAFPCARSLGAHQLAAACKPPGGDAGWRDLQATRATSTGGSYLATSDAMQVTSTSFPAPSPRETSSDTLVTDISSTVTGCAEQDKNHGNFVTVHTDNICSTTSSNAAHGSNYSSPVTTAPPVANTASVPANTLGQGQLGYVVTNKAAHVAFLGQAEASRVARKRARNDPLASTGFYVVSNMAQKTNHSYPATSDAPRVVTEPPTTSNVVQDSNHSHSATSIDSGDNDSYMARRNLAYVTVTVPEARTTDRIHQVSNISFPVTSNVLHDRRHRQIMPRPITFTANANSSVNDRSDCRYVGTSNKESQAIKRSSLLTSDAPTVTDQHHLARSVTHVAVGLVGLLRRATLHKYTTFPATSVSANTDGKSNTPATCGTPEASVVENAGSQKAKEAFGSKGTEERKSSCAMHGDPYSLWQGHRTHGNSRTTSCTTDRLSQRVLANHAAATCATPRGAQCLTATRCGPAPTMTRQPRGGTSLVHGPRVRPGVPETTAGEALTIYASVGRTRVVVDPRVVLPATYRLDGLPSTGLEPSHAAPCWSANTFTSAAPESYGDPAGVRHDNLTSTTAASSVTSNTPVAQPQTARLAISMNGEHNLVHLTALTISSFSH